MKTVQFRYVYSVFALALCAAACGSSSESSNTPIVAKPLSSWCARGSCSSSAGCDANAQCVNGQCLLLRCSRLGQPCDAAFGDIGCEPGLRCQDGLCIPGSSCVCNDGWCDAAGSCISDPCRTTVSCTRFGKCSTVGGFCMAWDDEDCAASEGCQLWGECAAGDLPLPIPEEDRTRHRTCWPAAPCNTSLGEEGVNACAEVGLCRADAGRCIADDIGACERSEACLETGACALYEGECWRQVGNGSECSSGGSLDDVCGAFGFCELVDGLYCQTGTDGHCDGSFLCQTFGECYAHDGECWARPEVTQTVD